MSGWVGPDLSPLVVHRHTDDLSDLRRWLLRRAETEIGRPLAAYAVGVVGIEVVAMFARVGDMVGQTR